jgi:hypothetical protein
MNNLIDSLYFHNSTFDVEAMSNKVLNAWSRIFIEVGKVFPSFTDAEHSYARSTLFFKNMSASMVLFSFSLKVKTYNAPGDVQHLIKLPLHIICWHAS